jgi:hypothetical protein
MQTEKTKTGGTALLLSSRLNFHNEVDGFDDKSITKTTTHGDLHRFGCRAAVSADFKVGPIVFACFSAFFLDIGKVGLSSLSTKPSRSFINPVLLDQNDAYVVVTAVQTTCGNDGLRLL